MQREGDMKGIHLVNNLRWLLVTLAFDNACFSPRQKIPEILASFYIITEIEQGPAAG
jgi:hypothetical protein